jgi:DNA repair exonuclease SbcCD nuclease subunit
MKEKPIFILTGDWHLRDTVPVARTDNFEETQWKKVQWVAELSKKYDCHVLHSGDLFHHWKTSPELLNLAVHNLPEKFATVYGNHDLPQHNLEEAEKCGMNVLINTGRIDLLLGTHFGKLPENETLTVGTKGALRYIAVWHVLTFKRVLPFPGCKELSAKEILKKYPEYDLILTGDNHKTFVQEYKGRLLVNPGSLMRQTAAQIDHKPSVFLYYASTNTVERVYVPIEDDVISREHITTIEQRNERIDAFVSSLNTDWEADISFKTNLDKFYAKNKVKKEVKDLITKFIDV